MIGLDLLGATRAPESDASRTVRVRVDYAPLGVSHLVEGDDPPLVRSGTLLIAEGEPLGGKVRVRFGGRQTPVFSAFAKGGVNYPPHAPIDYGAPWWIKESHVETIATPTTAPVAAQTTEIEQITEGASWLKRPLWARSPLLVWHLLVGTAGAILGGAILDGILRKAQQRYPVSAYTPDRVGEAA